MTMTAKKEPKDSKVKTPKLIHLPEDVAQQLAKAADAEGVSQSVYVMQLLRAKFKRGGVK